VGRSEPRSQLCTPTRAEARRLDLAGPPPVRSFADGPIPDGGPLDLPLNIAGVMQVPSDSRRLTGARNWAP
jgi:hypothetical protein